MVNSSSNRKLLEDADPVVAFDGRQSAIAAEIQRGVCRALRALGHSVVTELSLSNGRRADVVGHLPTATSGSLRLNPACSTFRPTANGPSTGRIATGSFSRCRRTSPVT